MRLTIFFLMMLCAALAGCGGGGGSAAAPTPKTTAVLKIGTQGALPAGVTGLRGVGVTITLPAGVTVATDGNGNPAGNVAVVSGVAVGGSVAPTYTPPTATAGATLRVVVAAGASLFGVGEFVTVTCLLPSGHTLSAGSFPASILSSLEPADQLLQPIQPANSLTPTIAATLY